MDTINRLMSAFRSPPLGFRTSQSSLAAPARERALDDHGGAITLPPAEYSHIPKPDAEFLCATGEKMLHTARVSGQSFTLAVLQVYDLPEVELLFGRAAAEKVIDTVMTELTRAAGRRGFVVRSEADTFALLVPAIGAQATLAALRSRFGEPCVVEIEVDKREILLIPDLRVHALDAGESVKQVYERLCLALDKERGLEARRCEYLRKERESYTLPMGLCLTTPQTRKPQFYPVLPPTIPVPMGAH